MCLWLLTACLGMLPTNPSPTIVVLPAGVPSPILVPTPMATTITTTTTTTTTTTARPAPPPMMMTGGPPASTVVTAMTPITVTTTAATAAPTAPPTPAPTTATTAPTAAPTAAPTTTTAATTATSLGSPAIDPRLGTTPAPSAAYQQPPIIGYNAQVQPYDDGAVKFPREKRSTKYNYETSVKRAMLNLFKNSEDEHKIRKRQTTCTCVPAGTCATNYGAGLLDVRIVTPGATQCPAGQVYCCGAFTTASVACGTLQQVPATSVAPASGQASFGEFPWQAMILTNQNDYLAGGVLIDQRNVLTVTHRLTNYVVSGTAPNVKVRLGEWDAAVTTEPVPFQEYAVSRVFTHPSYNPTTLQYDLTVLRLAAAVPLTPMAGAATTINRACLPPSSNTVYTGQRCMVSGWGKNMFGLPGLYQQILKKVDVPIVAPATCQNQMQTARLGASFVLDTTSFICAGGEANKDSCTGDGGSGLVCNVAGSWVVVGLVSWGLGCANTNVPAAYVNIAALLPWIQQQVFTP